MSETRPTRETDESHDEHRRERAPMSESSRRRAARAEAATYDVAAVEEKWRRVWAELDPFRADDDSARARSATR